MAFRIRQSAAGVEVEVDRIDEVALLMQMHRESGRSSPFLLSAAPSVDVPPAVSVRDERRTRPVVRRRAVKKSDAAPPVSPRLQARGPVDEKALVDALARGSASTRDLAKRLKQPRHKVSPALNALAAQGRVHSTGATASLRWHLGPATPAAPATSSPRRPL